MILNGFSVTYRPGRSSRAPGSEGGTAPAAAWAHSPGPTLTHSRLADADVQEASPSLSRITPGRFDPGRTLFLSPLNQPSFLLVRC
jgi:hypothetical protein